jgi:hypothetical protein
MQTNDYNDYNNQYDYNQNYYNDQNHEGDNLQHYGQDDQPSYAQQIAPSQQQAHLDSANSPKFARDEHQNMTDNPFQANTSEMAPLNAIR